MIRVKELFDRLEITIKNHPEQANGIIDSGHPGYSNQYLTVSEMYKNLKSLPEEYYNFIIGTTHPIDDKVYMVAKKSEEPGFAGEEDIILGVFYKENSGVITLVSDDFGQKLLEKVKK